MDTELESEIVKLLKINVPDEKEAFLLNGILEKGDEFGFSGKVDAILLLKESDEEEIAIEKSQDEIDLEEDIELENKNNNNKIIELEELTIDNM
ncbi:MAG: hypothetical protein Q8K30_05825 [Candidatus Gracilibacteria bacterium]|nr:hypothetical protein [Candidatus Gracilibacteria bacterium]